MVLELPFTCSSRSETVSSVGENLVQSQTCWGNKHPESHWILLWSRNLRLLLNFLILLRYYTRQQQKQQSTEMTSIVRCLHPVMSAADWSWRRNVLYFMNVTLQRGEWGKMREKRNLWWVLNLVRVHHNWNVCKLKFFLSTLMQNS